MSIIITTTMIDNMTTFIVFCLQKVVAVCYGDDTKIGIFEDHIHYPQQYIFRSRSKRLHH
jgi:hypothetical protein